MRATLLALAASVLAATIARPAAATVDVYPTGLAGDSPRLATANDGSMHILYYSSGWLRHARLLSGAFLDDTLLPGSDSVSHAKYNRPSLDTGPDSVPHVVWGPVASWTDATAHTKGVWYWNGTATTQIFDDYTEYVALGVSGSGEKVFATAVVFLPGDTAGRGIGWARLQGNVLDPVTRFSTTDNEGKHVAFCKGDDNALHLVWRMQKVRYTRWDGGAWSAVEGLGANLPSSAELPSCAVDGQGQPHVAWLRWQDTGGGAWAPVDLRYARKMGADWMPDSEGLTIRTLSAGGTSPAVAVQGDQVLIAWTEGSTLFSRLSTDGGGTFSAAEEQATDLEPGDDLANNAPQVPLVVYEGRFQTVYQRNDGALIRAAWAATPPPVEDAGADAVDDTGVDTGHDAAATSDTGVDAPADAAVDVANDSAAGDDAAAPGAAPADVGSDCACRVVAPRRGASGAAVASLLMLASLLLRRRS